MMLQKAPLWALLPAVLLALAAQATLAQTPGTLMRPAKTSPTSLDGAGAAAKPALALGNLPEFSVNCASLREKGNTGTTAITPKAMPQDSRLVVYAYDRNALYPANAFFNRYTHFEFEPGETVVGSYVNDDTEWEMKASGTGRDVLIRPKVRGASGSMTTITDRRRYQIELFDVSVCTSELRYQRVSWTYLDGTYENQDLISKGGQGRALGMGNANGGHAASSANPSGLPPLPGMAEVPSVGDAPMVKLDTLNTEYTMEGDPELMPVSVMDDGQRTMLKFRDAMALRPALFAVNTEGKAETVEYMPKGSYFLVSLVFTHGALLRLGKQEVKVKIKNKASPCGWFDTACKRMSVSNMGEQ